MQVMSTLGKGTIPHTNFTKKYFFMSNPENIASNALIKKK